MFEIKASYFFLIPSIFIFLVTDTNDGVVFGTTIIRSVGLAHIKKDRKMLFWLSFFNDQCEFTLKITLSVCAALEFIIFIGNRHFFHLIYN